MSPIFPFTAALLAGGKSRRMGSDKSLLPFGGQPLWHHQLRLLRDSGASELLLAAGDESRSWSPPADIFPRLVFDSKPGAGPLAGLAAALAASDKNHLLVLAVDMPYMTSELLRRLVSLALPDCGVVPTIGGWFEPTAAIYPKLASAKAEKRLSADELALQPFAAKGVADGWLRAWPVPPELLNCFTNWNSPADLHHRPDAAGI